MAVLFGVDPDTIVTTGDDWYTPRSVFDAAGLMFDVDVAAPVNPDHRTCPARSYLTAADDGLVTDWHGVVWCNPPYSDVTPWVRRWVEHPDGLILVPAIRSAWLVPLQLRADTLGLLGNIRFHRPDGTTATSRQAMVIAGRGSAAEAVPRVVAADYA